MFSFSFALSPLYRSICNRTGLSSAIPIGQNPDFRRDVLIQFVTSNHGDMNWDFYPLKKKVNVHPDDNTKIIFYAKNKTDKAMTVQAIPSFMPAFTAQYFHKTQCFCFNQQTLQPGESLEMPVIFHIDHDLPKEVSTITLAYTLFDVTSKK